MHKNLFNNIITLRWGESQMMCKSILLFKGEGQTSNSYYLLLKEYNDKSVYGIMISNETDSDYEEGVSQNKEEVVCLIEKFYKYNASPIHLIELIDDYVS